MRTTQTGQTMKLKRIEAGCYETVIDGERYRVERCIDADGDYTNEWQVLVWETEGEYGPRAKWECSWEWCQTYNSKWLCVEWLEEFGTVN